MEIVLLYIILLPINFWCLAYSIPKELTKICGFTIKQRYFISIGFWHICGLTLIPIGGILIWLWIMIKKNKILK